MTVEQSLWHHDGLDAAHHEPAIEPTDDGFRLIGAGVDDTPVTWSDLTFIDRRPGVCIYGHANEQGWRLGLIEPISEAILPHLPRDKVYGKWIDKIGLIPSTVVLGAISAAVATFILSLPNWVAPRIPIAWERNLGDVMATKMKDDYCHTDEGRAALDKLSAKMGLPATAPKVQVSYRNMVNAVALPGGQIIIFTGLLERAQTPDEIAGILGHEIGHVKGRDSMHALIRQAGISVLLGGLNGDIAGTMNSFITLSYGREAENAADRVSIEMMNLANISPLATADFFSNLPDGQSEGMLAETFNYASTHPLSNERRKVFETGIRRDKKYEMALSEEDWVALYTMCDNDPRIQEKRRYDYRQSESWNWRF